MHFAYPVPDGATAGLSGTTRAGGKASYPQATEED